MSIKKNIFLFKFFGFLVVMLSGDVLRAVPRSMIIAVPIADLRAECKLAPLGFKGPALSKDLGGQSTQLLLGESIIGEPVSKTSNWLKVKALEQKIYSPTVGWISCPGYIHKNQAVQVVTFPSYNLVVKKTWGIVYKEQHDSDILVSLPCGAKIQGKQVDAAWWQVFLPDGRAGYMSTQELYEITPQITESGSQLRRVIVTTAKQFLGNPYVWGGRSYVGSNAPENQVLGADCSSFFELIYRSAGLRIPRNAHSQYLASQQLATSAQVKPGDLIFLASKDAVRGLFVRHVMMYIGKGLVIEATGNPDGLESVPSTSMLIAPEKLVTRIISVKKRLGKSLTQIKSKQTCIFGIEERIILFGTFLQSRKFVQKLRDDAYNCRYKGLKKS